METKKGHHLNDQITQVGVELPVELEAGCEGDLVVEVAEADVKGECVLMELVDGWDVNRKCRSGL